VFLDARRHGVVLVRPLARASVFAALGAIGLAVGWPASVAGGAFLLAAGLVATLSVWRWDRTHVVVTGDSLLVEQGLVRRRTASVRLSRIRGVEVEQSLLGRVLGYGTVVAGELEIAFVPDPSGLSGLVQDLSR